jgi:PadR family transcriptional regulator, regulatory protein PadR
MSSVKAPGRLEFIVLLAVLKLRDKAYAVPVRAAIARDSGRDVSRGALYVTLSRLEEKGFLRSALGDPTPERGGRGKRFYEVTPLGMDAIRAGRDELEKPWRGLGGLLKASGK